MHRADSPFVHATLATIASLAFALPFATADFVAFDESVSGDASDDRFAPSTAALVAGNNTLRGLFGASATPDVHDLDYITFTVPEGHRLTSFVVADANVGGAFSFVGIQAGPIVTIPADWTSVESPLLGWAHFGTSSVGQDILAELGSAPGAEGFTGPLGAGTYALWIMELDSSDAYSYSFSLGVVEIPAPGAIAVLALGALVGSRRSKRA
jgi:hypothetical protein